MQVSESVFFRVTSLCAENKKALKKVLKKVKKSVDTNVGYMYNKIRRCGE